MTKPRFRKREREVIEQLIKGKSNKQIAQKMGISVRTVEFHLSNIYSRLDVHSRTEAVIKLAENNMRQPASRNTGRVLRKSTVAKKSRSGENGGNQTKRRFPMKNLLIGIAIGISVTLIIAVAFVYIPDLFGKTPVSIIDGPTPTMVPFEVSSPTPVFFETPTPVPTETQMNGVETPTAIPVDTPTKKP